MYTNVSSAFTTKLAKPSRHFAARFKYNNSVLDFDIKSITMTIGTCGGSSFAVGCAFAGYIEVTMKYTDTLLEGKELALELGLLLDNGNYEYVPFGRWTVQKPTKNNDMMTFQAVDRMASKLSDDYETSLTYPATIANVISELATNTGLTINCSLQTSNTLAVKIDGVTNRGALAIIAATLLGNAWVDRNGNIQITKTTMTNPVSLNYDYVKTQPQMDEEATVIGGVRVYTVAGSRDTWIERGSGTMVEVSDVYMTSTILDSVRNNVMGLTYNGGEVSFMGNPLLDPSDAVQFNSAYTVPCMEIVHKFDGGLLTTVTGPGKFEATDSTIQVGAITEELSKRAQEAAMAQATADEALSIAADVSRDFADAVLQINGDISDLQNQIDGNITTWFYAVDPTTSNPPASSWTTTDEKNNHLGDLYYNTESGYAWRWMKEGNTFSWGRITDSDVTEALALAQTAQDTADGKRRVFYTTPTPPYDKGDLWVQGSTGDIKYCNTARSSGSYNASDWVLASKYTDDTAANAAQATANNAVNMANGKNKTFFQNNAPTSGMVAGDLWFDTDGGNAIYEYKVTSNVGTWTLRQLGQGSIVAGSITGNEIYGNTLSSIFADVGEITAGILRSSNYSYTSGNTYTTAGMIIDLNNKIIRTTNTAILSDGTIHATNGVFSGTINATAGTIGGWTIDSLGLERYTSNTDYFRLRTNYIDARTADGSIYIEPGGNISATDNTPAGSSSLIWTLSKPSSGRYAWISSDSFMLDAYGTHSSQALARIDITSNEDVLGGRLHLGQSDDAGSLDCSFGCITIRCQTSDSNSYTSTNPYFEFANSTNTKRIKLIFTDSASVQSPASLTLVGNQGGEYFIAPNIKVSSSLVFTATTDVGIIQGYNSTTKYNILRNHGNGNVSLSACSGDLHLGYTNTNNISFFNGKATISSAGHLEVAGYLTGYSGLILCNSALTKGTTPSADTSKAIVFTDKDGFSSSQNDVISVIYGGVGSTGTSYSILRTYAFTTANANSAQLALYYPASGAQYAEFNCVVQSNASDTGERYFRAKNSNGSIELNASSGNKGIYDRSGGQWIMYVPTNSTSSSAAIIPRPLQVTGHIKADGNYYFETGGGVIIRNSALTKGTTPSAETYKAIAFTDKDGWSSSQNDSICTIYGGVNASNLAYMFLRTYMPTTANSNYAQLAIYYPSSGTQYAEFNCVVQANASDTSERYVRAKNSAGQVELNASAYNKGLYDRTGGEWIIRVAAGSTSTSAATIPRPLLVSGNIDMTAASGSTSLNWHYSNASSATSSIVETASGALRINADLRVPSIWGTTTTSTASVNIVDSNGLLRRYSSSSKRYKHDITPLGDYKKVLDIPVVSFVYNDGYLGKGDQREGKHIPGFIAEDVYEAFPIAVDVMDGKVEDWNAKMLIPPMLAVEQEHEKRITALERENAELKARLKKLEVA